MGDLDLNMSHGLCGITFDFSFSIITIFINNLCYKIKVCRFSELCNNIKCNNVNYKKLYSHVLSLGWKHLRNLQVQCSSSFAYIKYSKRNNLA